MEHPWLVAAWPPVKSPPAWRPQDSLPAPALPPVLLLGCPLHKASQGPQAHACCSSCGSVRAAIPCSTLGSPAHTWVSYHWHERTAPAQITLGPPGLARFSSSSPQKHSLYAEPQDSPILPQCTVLREPQPVPTMALASPPKPQGIHNLYMGRS